MMYKCCTDCECRDNNQRHAPFPFSSLLFFSFFFFLKCRSLGKIYNHIKRRTDNWLLLFSAFLIILTNPKTCPNKLSPLSVKGFTERWSGESKLDSKCASVSLFFCKTALIHVWYLITRFLPMCTPGVWIIAWKNSVQIIRSYFSGSQRKIICVLYVAPFKNATSTNLFGTKSDQYSYKFIIQ